VKHDRERESQSIRVSFVCVSFRLGHNTMGEPNETTLLCIFNRAQLLLRVQKATWLSLKVLSLKGQKLSYHATVVSLRPNEKMGGVHFPNFRFDCRFYTYSIHK